MRDNNISILQFTGAGFKNDDFFKGQKIVPKNPIPVKNYRTIGKFLDDF